MDNLSQDMFCNKINCEIDIFTVVLTNRFASKQSLLRLSTLKFNFVWKRRWNVNKYNLI